MFTKIGKEECIEEAARLINAGEVVAFPTETVYGLGANAFNESAVKKIYEAKNRPSDNPFIVHLPSLSEVEKAAYLTEEAIKLFEVFTPGPLTIILNKKKEIPSCVTAGLDTVGIRIPSHPLGHMFLEACGVPIAAPSANISKKVSPTSAKYVFEDMNGRIPLILDGGNSDVGIESTVISLAGDEPVILRPGGITLEMLQKYVPNIRYFSGTVKVAPSPGMKYKHYSPDVPCVLYSTKESAKNEYKAKVLEGLNPVVMAVESECMFFEKENIKCISLGKDSKEFAHNIFDYLRTYEKEYNYLIVQALSGDGIEYSIMNRLLKSSAGKII